MYFLFYWRIMQFVAKVVVLNCAVFLFNLADPQTDFWLLKSLIHKIVTSRAHWINIYHKCDSITNIRDLDFMRISTFTQFTIFFNIIRIFDIIIYFFNCPKMPIFLLSVFFLFYLTDLIICVVILGLWFMFVFRLNYIV